ncbi:hypothetical protein X777_06680 [Ooceraea biroi]|uniref:Uncharacterized protein n=1 Tax=Ooceraea biroi TaxID=2015173 RepID=A0A026WFI4_OOCBI|nr:hypothetical protein X777_06680 [Ooceraea biroi]
MKDRGKSWLNSTSFSLSLSPSLRPNLIPLALIDPSAESCIRTTRIFYVYTVELFNSISTTRNIGL